jgi:hypothetical protein
LIASDRKRASEQKNARQSRIKLIRAIVDSLENMDPQYCELSKLNYEEIELDDGIEFAEALRKAKYLERPFAYEFYHQLRCLLDNKTVDFGRALIQGEVDKRYQHVPGVGDIPDFIIHVPDSPEDNYAVIEFKLASQGVKDISEDLDKLVGFQGPDLHYDHIVEVIIGTKKELERRREPVRSKAQELGQPITIVEFNIESWKARASVLHGSAIAG